MLGFGVNFFGESGSKKEGIKVGEIVISPEEVYAARRNQEDYYRQMFGSSYENLRPMIESNLTGSVIDNLIKQELLSLIVEDEGLRSSNRSVAEYLSSNLFPKGYSDKEYAEFLRVRGKSALAYQEDVRREVARFELQNSIQDLVSVSDEEVNSTTTQALTKIDLKYQEFKHEDYLSSVTDPGDEVLKEIWNKDLTKYKLPPTVSYEYIVLNNESLALDELAPIETSEVELYYADHQGAFTESEEIHSRGIFLKYITKEGKIEKEDRDLLSDKILEDLKKGANFQELFAKYNEDPALKKSDGVLPILRKDKGDLTPLENQVLLLTESQQYGKYATEEGIYLLNLIKVVPARLKPFIEVAETIKSRLALETAPAIIAAIGEEMYSALSNGEIKTFPNLLEKFNDKLSPNFRGNAVSLINNSGGPLSVKSPLSGILKELTTLVLAKRLEEWQRHDVDGKVILVHVLNVVEEKDPEFSAIRDTLLDFYRVSEAPKIAATKGLEFIKSYQLGTPLSNQIMGVSLNGLAAGEFREHSFLTPPLIEKLLSYSNLPALHSETVEHQGKHLVLLMDKVMPPSDEERQKELPSIVQKLSRERGEMLLASLVAMKKSETKIDVDKALFGS
jgi:parvulin-like peptidyl-prolyl isomerase